MSMVTYKAQFTVHLGQIKSEVRAGETFQFDGQNIILRGETHLLPSIKVAIDQGWFQQVESITPTTGGGAKAKTPVKTKSGSDLKSVVPDQNVASSRNLSPASSTPNEFKGVQVRGVQNVESTTQSGFRSNVIRSDDDETTSTGRTFTSGVVKKATTLEGSSQEGQVVGKVFKTATTNKLVINNESDLSREASNLEKKTTADSTRSGFVDSRESQTVRQTGRIEKTASQASMDTVENDGSFVTQTTDGVTFKVKGGFNRKAMKVVSMEGDTFMDENGVGAVVVGRAAPLPIQTRSVNQAAVEAADPGTVIDVTTPSQKPFAWDMSKHWKTRVREASQYRDQPEIYQQIIAQETETVVKHLNSTN
jgi:hypothetical protein